MVDFFLGYRRGFMGTQLARLAVLVLFGTFLTNSVSAQSAKRIAYAKSVLAEAQTASIQSNREYCGYIGINDLGNRAAIEPRRGWKGSCRPKAPPDDWNAVSASYHTHGGYHPNVDSEVPSVSDVETDHDEGVDGWLVTPGGRVWFINGFHQTARLICDQGCLPADPDYQDGDWPPIETFYTLEMLIERDDL